MMIEYDNINEEGVYSMSALRQANKVRFTVTMDPDLYEAVEQFSEGRRGRVSGVIEDCVRGYLSILEAREAPTAGEDLLGRLVTRLTDSDVLADALRIASLARGKDVSASDRDELDELMDRDKGKKQGKEVG